MPAHDLTLVTLDISELSPYHRNPRRGDIAAIARSLEINGQYRPIVVNLGTHTGRPLEVLAGNHTLAAARTLGWAQIAATTIDVDDVAAARIVAADNRTADLGDYDTDTLLALLHDLPDLDGTGYDDDYLDSLLGEQSESIDPTNQPPNPTLADRFGIPPFTVIDTTKGEWQQRKQALIALGLDSGEGRAEGLVFAPSQRAYTNWYDVKNKAEKSSGRQLTEDEILASPFASDLRTPGGGTSIFDPVLTEIIYTWYAPKGGVVLDPWAGGSVRGVIAGRMGLSYTGVDIRAEQIAANIAQWDTLGIDGPTPRWVHGNSSVDMPDITADLVIGCPPYYSLEKYSDDPGDLSTMTPEDFNQALVDTARLTVPRMHANSFAVFVVGPARTPTGRLLDLRSAMIDAWEGAGLTYVQDAVILNPVGSMAIAAARAFTSTRTLGRRHQEMIVFAKGRRQDAVTRLTDPSETLAALASMTEVTDGG